MEKTERAILAGVHTGRRDSLYDTTDESIRELAELVKTAGAEVVGEMVQNKSDIEAATYMGEGKVEELRCAVEGLSADVVVFDDELSPVQTRNLTELLGVKVLDRSMLILDIFALHAKTAEGKLQVELAQLKYRLPRLRGLGTELSRTGGGIGTRGPGETKLETDRRHIHRRVSALEEELRELEKRRGLLRGRRKKDGVVTVALVGYTNAGKSSLLNALTDAGILAENKLFATLDPTSRALTLFDNRTLLLVDTVGFIRKLPHHLVQAFRSTLEEAVVADVLLHVIDASSPERENQIQVVDEVLSDIGAGGKPIVGVFNKCDKAEGQIIVPIEGYDACVQISAKYRTGIDTLLETLSDVAPGKKEEMTVCLPYSEGALASRLHETEKVLSEEYVPEGIQMRLLVDTKMYDRLKAFTKEL
jgi:GTP-binding protein HflX